MKKLIFLFLLIPSMLFSQINGVIIFEDESQINYSNKKVIEYLTRNLNRIISIGGETEIAVPIYKIFFKKTKGLFIEGYFAQFDDLGNDISLKKVDARMMIFDFDKKTIKIKDQTDDDNDWQKPKDLKKKVKDKYDKIKSKD